MAQIKFEIDDSFYDQLLARIKQEKDELEKAYLAKFPSPYSPYSKVTLPTIQELEKLIENVFWTSIQLEEGRPLKFSVVFGEDYKKIVDFKDPLPFDVAHLTKIAPALNTEDLVVSVKTLAGNILSIDGVVDSFLYLFRIKVINPGEIVIAFASVNLALISGDNISLINKTNIKTDSNIWKLLDLGISKDPLVNYKISLCVQILRDMKELGHGGALIIVKDKSNLEKYIKPIAYSDNKLSDFLTEQLNYYQQIIKDKGLDSDDAVIYRQILNGYAKKVAKLSAVDGAVILDSGFNLIGFGVKLSKLKSPRAIHRTDPFTDETWTKVKDFGDLGGMRHQSAASFVFNHKNAVAIVVSQDGHITAFTYEENQPKGTKGKTNKPNLRVYKRIDISIL